MRPSLDFLTGDPIALINHMADRVDIHHIFPTSYLIDPTLARADDFHGFIRDRATRLLDLIERSTGRTVSGRDADEVKKAFGGVLAPAHAAAPAAAVP